MQIIVNVPDALPQSFIQREVKQFEEKLRKQAEDEVAGSFSHYANAYIPDSVIAECIFVLLKVYKIPKSDICEKLAKICAYTGIIESNREILLLSLTLFSKHNVDIVDAIVHATAQCQNWEKISFDHDMKKFT